jgi:hypothetical protein
MGGSKSTGAGVNSGTHTRAQPRDVVFTFVEKLHPPAESSARKAPALDRVPTPRAYADCLFSHPAREPTGAA